MSGLRVHGEVLQTALFELLALALQQRVLRGTDGRQRRMEHAVHLLARRLTSSHALHVAALANVTATAIATSAAIDG